MFRFSSIVAALVLGSFAQPALAVPPCKDASVLRSKIIKVQNTINGVCTEYIYVKNTMECNDAGAGCRQWVEEFPAGAFPCGTFGSLSDGNPGGVNPLDDSGLLLVGPAPVVETGKGDELVSGTVEGLMNLYTGAVEVHAYDLDGVELAVDPKDGESACDLLLTDEGAATFDLVVLDENTSWSFDASEATEAGVVQESSAVESALAD